MTENNKIIENIKEKEDGIITFKGYTFWNKAKVVKPYIIQYLKNSFSDKLILSEFNKIDLLVLRKNIPVEIQSTPVLVKKLSILHSEFENSIRRQLEDNIENYGLCWFFFDAEYYRYLSEATNTQIALNLDWFAKYVKEDKLKVFTIKYNGEIKELKYEYLEFIRKLSNTCKIEYDSDDRVLNRNKLDIVSNMLEGHKFTQIEIDRFTSLFNERKTVGDNEVLCNFLMKKKDNREKCYGDIMHAIGNLNGINKFLDINPYYNKAEKANAERLDIIETTIGRNSHTKFIDKFNVCQYFPGYIRNKEIWNSLKNRTLIDAQLKSVFSSYKNKNQSNLLNF